MILRGDKDDTSRPSVSGGPTLDDLFRRAGVRSPNAPALIDPPNRATFASDAPRALTYAQADRAISALAAKLCRLGLKTDTVVAIQLPNTVEGIVTLLAVLRAGMIAVPVPLLWRSHDLKAALGLIGARAIITTDFVAGVDHAQLAMEVAAELFPIRFVCAFGDNLPDGVVPLDDIFTSEQNAVVPRSPRTGHAADHVAVVTFDVTSDGLVPVARNHAQLLAGGGAVATRNGTMLSAIPPTSFAGLAATVLPWLLAGGTLALHHAFNPVTFFAQCEDHACSMIVLPGPALSAIGATVSDVSTSLIALWRSPEQLASAARWGGDGTVVDVSCFGEVGLVATTRGSDGLPADIPLGPVGTALETARRNHGTLALRGPMVPVQAFPPGAALALKVSDDGFLDTGFTCRLDHDAQSLTISGPPGGIIAIGGYRFRPADLDRQVHEADPSAAVVALPGSVTAQKLAGRALDPDAVRDALTRNGANPLIADAFRPRGAANAA